MSRTRFIRPGFFSDERMSHAKLPTRFVYIGLWTLCDDAGFFERRPAEIAVALFPYERVGRRQKLVDDALAELEELGRVRWLECGEHGLIPTLPEHVVKGGNHAYQHQVKHENQCRLTLFRLRSGHDGIRPENGSPGRVRDKSVSESVSESGSGLESGRGAPRGLKEAATAAGGFVATLAEKP